MFEIINRSKSTSCCLLIIIATLTASCSSPDVQRETKAEVSLDETYLGLRGLALSNAAAIEEVEGVVTLLMEFYVGDEVVTLMAAADGSASLYFGNGGGQIGNGRFPEVREAVSAAIEEAGNYVDGMESVTEYPMPEAGNTRFYAVTPSGVHSVQVPDAELQQEGSMYFSLFSKSQDILTAIRLASEE